MHLHSVPNIIWLRTQHQFHPLSAIYISIRSVFQNNEVVTQLRRQKLCFRPPLSTSVDLRPGSVIPISCTFTRASFFQEHGPSPKTNAPTISPAYGSGHLGN